MPILRTKAIKDPALAAKDPDFAVQGEYAATADIGLKESKGQYGLQVVALGEGNFRAALYKGLPGSGAENNEFILLTGSTEEGKTILKAKSGETVVIKGDTATGSKATKNCLPTIGLTGRARLWAKKAPGSQDSFWRGRDGPVFRRDQARRKPARGRSRLTGLVWRLYPSLGIRTPYDLAPCPAIRTGETVCSFNNKNPNSRPFLGSRKFNFYGSSQR